MSSPSLPRTFWSRLLARIIRLLDYENDKPSVQYRGRTLIRIIAYIALVVVVHTAYLLVAEVITPGEPDPDLPWILAIKAAFLVASGIALFVAQQGRITRASVLWMIGVAAASISAAVIHPDQHLYLMVLSLLANVIVASTVIAPVAGFYVSIGLSLSELALIVSLRPDLPHDIIAGMVGFTVLVGVFVWAHVTSFDRTNQLNDENRRNAESLQGQALALSDAYVDLIQKSRKDLEGRKHLIRMALGELRRYDGTRLSDEGLQALRFVDLNLVHLDRLERQILRIAHFEAYQTAVEGIRYQPASLMQLLVDLCAPVAEAGGLHFRCLVLPQVPEVAFGDPIAIEHALVNVVDNAVKFTSSGSIVVEAARPDHDHWRVTVTDTGPGFPRSVINRMHASIASDQHGGGLAFAQALIEAQGGMITIQNHAAKGATVAIILPLHSRPDR